MKQADAIYACATAPGRAGVAVIRVSGPAAASAVRALTRRDPPIPRRAAYTRFYSADGLIDDGLTLWFPAPASFTGEDVAEFQCHGGPAVVAAMQAALTALPGLRLAEPGEFTRRAFDNRKLDLTQAEGLADLIDAETEAQRRAARMQLDGAFGRTCAAWAGQLTRILAFVEATIDFSDEELPDDLLDAQVDAVRTLQRNLADALHGAAARMRLRRGAVVALVGAPNAGKSTLINALVGEDVAITSPIPGATRDALEARTALNGVPVTLVDLAGLRAASDDLERLGVDRALSRAETADLRLFLCAPDAPPPPETEQLRRPGDVTVWNKADIAPPFESYDAVISALTGAGVDALAGQVAQALNAAGDASAPGAVRARHVAALTAAQEALASAAHCLTVGGDIALSAEHLRIALREIGRLTGAVDVEDLLGVIFGEFCIGK